MVSTAYLQRALPVYDLVVPPETTSVNRVTHAFHVFRLKSAVGGWAPLQSRDSVYHDRRCSVSLHPVPLQYVFVLTPSHYHGLLAA
jgi:hypothetical protein